jgi:TolA-binding protein
MGISWHWKHLKRLARTLQIGAIGLGLAGVTAQPAWSSDHGGGHAKAPAHGKASGHGDDHGKASAHGDDHGKASAHGDDHGKASAPAVSASPKAGASAASARPVHSESSFALKVREFVGIFVSAWHSGVEKVEALREADEEVERLSLENANLRLQLESQEFECELRVSQKNADSLAARLGRDTGSTLGRTLANITYRPPTHLLPSQLYTLAVGYMKAKEEEKAAVILTFLSGLDDESEYRTAKNLLLTGVAWYRVDNYDLADQYFKRVLENKVTAATLPYHAQSRVWRGLVAQRKGQPADAQVILKDLLARHPRTKEAKLINPLFKEEEDRAPASEK